MLEAESGSFDFIRCLPKLDFPIICNDLTREASRILVLGMGGGCDVFSAYAIAKHVDKMRTNAHVLFGNCVGTRNMGMCVQLSPYLWSTPPDVVPLQPGDEGYGSTRLEESCPRGPEGSPLLFVIPGYKGDLSELTAANVAALVPSLASLNVDLVIAVDNGGDSISGGVDFKESPEAGRDMQVLHCLKISNIPFTHIVLGPGCDGETKEADMQSSIQRLASDSCIQGVFCISPLVADMADCSRTLHPFRTPNIMARAFSGELPSVQSPDGLREDYIRICRHDGEVCLPRAWMIVGLAIKYNVS